MRALVVLTFVATARATWTPRLSPRSQALAFQAAEAKAAQNATIFDPAHDPRFVHFDCGTSAASHATEHLIATHKALDNQYSGTGPPGAKLRARALQTRDDDSTPVVIPTAMHIVTKLANTTTISQDAPQKQIEALNKAYATVGFSFNLLGTTWTANDAWAVGGADADVAAMKKALRQGNYSTLNLYFQTDLAGGVLGVCSMPSNISDPNDPNASIDPSSYSDDGCSVNAGTMPGGSIYGYSQGMTAIHETGHWLGLFHVFEGYSCDGDGDLIDDTPPQSMSTDGCPVSPPQDSCPGDFWGVGKTAGITLPPGVNLGDPMLDAVHNIMDYSTDACYTGFTPLQIARMKNLWGLYRAGR